MPADSHGHPWAVDYWLVIHGLPVDISRERVQLGSRPARENNAFTGQPVH